MAYSFLSEISYYVNMFPAIKQSYSKNNSNRLECVVKSRYNYTGQLPQTSFQGELYSPFQLNHYFQRANSE